MHFAACWPDGEVVRYYSPSLVVLDYLTPGATYALDEFVERSRAALRCASERVRAKYGFACPRAASSMASIENRARAFSGAADATVRIEAAV